MSKRIVIRAFIEALIERYYGTLAVAGLFAGLYAYLRVTWGGEVLLSALFVVVGLVLLCVALRSRTRARDNGRSAFSSTRTGKDQGQ